MSPPVVIAVRGLEHNYRFVSTKLLSDKNSGVLLTFITEFDLKGNAIVHVLWNSASIWLQERLNKCVYNYADN